MDSHNMIPITLFIMAGIAVSVLFVMQFLARKAMQDTLKAAVAAGQKLDDETIKAMSQKVPSTPEADLQSGLKDIALGAGFVVSAIVVRYQLDKDFSAILLIVGIILAAGGVGALASWRIRSKPVQAK